MEKRLLSSKRGMLAVILAVAMVFSLLPGLGGGVSAAEGDVIASGNCGAGSSADNVTYTVTKNADGKTYTLTIEGSGGMYNYSAEYSLGAGTYWVDKVTSVVIKEGVTSIGTSAFWGCTSLASVTIPDSVTSIGDRAFLYCSSLASVTIPDSVTSIGDAAFRSIQ